MALQTEILIYQADGLTMRSHLYFDDATRGPRPGVLIFPTAFGISDHERARGERLAALGYTALACDLHGDGIQVEKLAEALGMLSGLREDASRSRARAQGGLTALAARAECDATKVSAIGFCFGGTMALELARSGADLRGVVGFHSGLATKHPEDAKRVRGKILVCIGADDPSIPLEQRAAFEHEMRAAKIDWRMHLYGGVVHGFTNIHADKLGRPEMARYDAGADSRSWQEMQAFMQEVFA